jgi:ABC-type lipoprotein export system ATPase subunit
VQARVALLRSHHQPAELSGGQEQRAAIARALVSQPQIVLADEPTGNLDSHTCDQVMELFRDLNARGTTLLIVTHDAEAGAAARHILHLRDDRFVSHAVASGVPSAIPS